MGRSSHLGSQYHLAEQLHFSYLFEDDPEWEEGLKEDEWIVDNIDWLSQCFIDNDIPVEEEFFRWFYQAVNVADWRCSSCGGCI